VLKLVRRASIRFARGLPALLSLSVSLFTKRRRAAALQTLREYEGNGSLFCHGGIRFEGENRVEARADAERLMKRLAEMAEAGVADFKGGFGDVVLASAKEFGGPFHAQLADELREGQADLLRKSAAQIKWAATDLRADLVERGRGGEIRL
jgi:hypothetical protein